MKNMELGKKVGRRSYGYEIVRRVVKIAFNLFYRRVNVLGRENIPRNGRIIFAANHQNALMDALAIICTNNYQPVFLARADIFKNSVISALLTFFKIMPVFRFRDGIDNMEQNKDTFLHTTMVLKSGGAIGIMPEGNHGSQKRLRILKKGIFRIAFSAEEALDNEPGVCLVPVGLDFSNTQDLFSILTVNYGKPLYVKEYLKLYISHPQKGMNAMKRDLAQSIKSLMVDIYDESNYENDKILVDIGSGLLNERIAMPYPKGAAGFYAEKEFAESMYSYFGQNPDKAGELRSYSREISETFLKYNIPFWYQPGDERSSPVKLVCTAVACLPFIFAGVLLHIIPFSVINIINNRIEDKQFVSSNVFVLGVLLLPLNYVLAGVLLFSSLPVLPATVLLFVIMPVTGILSWFCFRKMSDSLVRFKLGRLFKNDSDLFDGISDKWGSIISGIEPVLSAAETKLKYFKTDYSKF